MKNKIQLITLMLISLLALPKIHFGQSINLGAAADFVFFTIDGAIGDNAVSHSHVTGDVGYENSGAITGFGNVNGVMHAGVDAATTAAGLALPAAITQINAKPVDFFPPSGTMGNGDTLIAGVYSIPGAATQNLNLYLDAKGISSAEFIIKIGGTFSAAANSKVILLNGAKACHVFWEVADVVSMATGTVMRGNILASAAINMSTLDTLEGRALTTVGAITIDGVLAYTPIGCGSPVLTGPPAPDLASAACYTIFSSIGALSNTPPTAITGDVGKNNDGDAITGWLPAYVTGTLHSTQDASTIQCTTDLSNAYSAINALVPDIELLYPSEFGHDLVLTPHTYLMNSGGAFGPAALTDTVYLDAQNNPDGVFVIKITGGALTTSTYANVKLINGTQSKNVFWMVQGQVDINNYSIFRGTIIVPVGAINMVNTGIQLDGRALSMNGAITTTGLTAIASCGNPPNIIAISNNATVCAGSAVTFTVNATGTNLTYKWRKGLVDLSNGVTISGVTTPTLTINPVAVSDSSSLYNVVVSGLVSPNDTSTNVSLTVNTAPTITLQPTGNTVCAGSTASFTVAATGTALTYQWRKGIVNLSNGVTISGVTSATLTINSLSIADAAVNYNVVVSGTCAPSATSTNVSLTVNTAPTITLQPTGNTVCAGSTASFTVAATGTALTYQWRKGIVNLNNGVTISGVTSATLTINSLSIADAAVNYNVVVSGTCAPNDTSTNVILSVNPIPVAVASSNSPVCLGSSIHLTAQTVTGATYSWKGPNGYSSSTQNPIIPSASATTAGTYSLIVTNNGCVSSLTTSNIVISNCADLSVIKTVNDSLPSIGNSIIFTIATTNNGPSDATGVFVTDSLQSGYSYVSSSTTKGTYDASTGIWTIGTMNNGTSETLTITAKLIADGNYFNTAVVKSNAGDSNLVNNTSIIRTYPVDFNIPEGFSPNGDGINDLFVIRGINRYPKNTFVIFNRWGDEVLNTNDYQNTWDGKSSKGVRVGGDELPIGTYFYVLNLGDGSTIFKGTIYLNK